MKKKYSTNICRSVQFSIPYSVAWRYRCVRDENGVSKRRLVVNRPTTVIFQPIRADEGSEFDWKMSTEIPTLGLWFLFNSMPFFPANEQQRLSNENQYFPLAATFSKIFSAIDRSSTIYSPWTTILAMRSFRRRTAWIIANGLRKPYLYMCGGYV